MSLTNPNTPISEQDLKDFYEKIKPYLGTNAAPSEDMAEIVSPLPSIPTRKIKYSTDEQMVGEWIDGKPIYQKTFVDIITVDSSNLNISYAHNISNVDVVVGCYGLYGNADNTSKATIPIMWDGDSAVISANRTNISLLRTNVNFIKNSVVSATIQYTKTTD